ncbi:hypothetical protein Bcep18194_B1100 [Burkholderia lata]|uniref:Uncharacterized protein n=1 Tax=Burkholderia lata (strain ATCC 17760 / DSM 23089 / LMG 22485 / NCIMB 9086 / R18194 / 383) TaxID=482957 RepID=Q397Z7_BURL3|nr:hypothetical protein Bcep18194_B1100 [Burkholderia lata]
MDMDGRKSVTKQVTDRRGYSVMLPQRARGSHPRASPHCSMRIVTPWRVNHGREDSSDGARHAMPESPASWKGGRSGRNVASRAASG